MYTKVFAITALAGYVAAAPHIYARQNAGNSTTSGVAAMGTGMASYGSYADAGGKTFMIPTAISVPAAEQSQIDSDNKKLAKEVASEVTNVQRFNQLLTVDGMGTELLSGDDLQKRVVFNFNEAPAQGNGGRFKLANVNAFPILAEQGISTAVGFLKPCSMNSPHTHPRATEWLTVVQGNLTSGYILENGFVDPDGKEGAALASEVRFNIGAFEGTVFPQGSIHYQFNDNCEPATFIATLNSEDPGTSQATQNLFFLNEDVVSEALGPKFDLSGKDIADFRGMIPANLVKAMESCKATCGY